MIALCVIGYVVAGLFASRWWWRRDVAPFDMASQVMAFWIVLLWPLYIGCTPIYAAVRAFYGQPMNGEHQ